MVRTPRQKNKPQAVQASDKAGKNYSGNAPRRHPEMDPEKNSRTVGGGDGLGGKPPSILPIYNGGIIMDMTAYYAVFVPEDEGKVSVWFPDVPGCASWGESAEHAFLMAMEALEGHLEAMFDDGDPIPEPSGHAQAWEKVLKDFGGDPVPEGTSFQLVPVQDVREKPRRINVSLRPSTITMIDRKAENLGMTRSGFLAAAASAYEMHQHV